jgi:L-lysine exporter family protein LysE/ArgO
MEYLLLGFFTGLSLILAIGAQNIFVIEQGLKKQHVFLVCLVCSISDLILIFLGIFIFEFFSKYFNSTVELIFNIALVIFLIHFIYSKIKNYKTAVNFDTDVTSITAFNILLKTLGFTYLNPHVYSDTVFFLGNFSKNFIIQSKNIFWNWCVNCFFFIFFLNWISFKIFI